MESNFVKHPEKIKTRDGWFTLDALKYGYFHMHKLGLWHHMVLTMFYLDGEIKVQKWHNGFHKPMYYQGFKSIQQARKEYAKLL